MTPGRFAVAALASALTAAAYLSLGWGAPVPTQPPTVQAPTQPVEPGPREAATGEDSAPSMAMEQAELDQLEKQVRRLRQELAAAEGQMLPSYQAVLQAGAAKEQEQRRQVEDERASEAERARQEMERRLHQPRFVITGGRGRLPQTLALTCRVEFEAKVRNVGSGPGHAVLSAIGELQPRSGPGGPSLMGSFSVDLGPGEEETYRAEYEVPCVTPPAAYFAWWAIVTPDTLSYDRE